jgi:DNA-binding IclR family transcriptional regulator
MSDIQVIDRAAALIDAIASHNEPTSLKILSAETRLHTSTTFRILGALVEIGYVDKDEQGLYRLGHKLAQLAAHIDHDIDIRSVAIAIMDKLRDITGDTINLTIREGDEVVYIERSTVKRMMRVEQVIGSRAPLHVTAVGKLMLAELGDTFISEYAKRNGLKAFTRHTITNPMQLIEHAHLCAERGYALDDEEAELGVGCIGVLLRDRSGQVVGGLSVSAPIERRQTSWIQLLQDASREISAKLGYSK